MCKFNICNDNHDEFKNRVDINSNFYDKNYKREFNKRMNDRAKSYDKVPIQRVSAYDYAQSYARRYREDEE